MEQIKIIDYNALLSYHQRLKTLLNEKMDLKEGYSLLPDEEITRIASFINYDDSFVQSSLSLLAEKIEALEQNPYDDTALWTQFSQVEEQISLLQAHTSDASYI